MNSKQIKNVTKLIVIFVSIFFIFGQLTVLAASASGIHVVQNENRSGVEIDLTANTQYQVAFVDAPPRVVIDLQHTMLATSVNRSALANTPIKNIRTGVHENGQLRIVLDLQKRMPFRYKFFTAANGKSRLFISLGESKPAPKKAVVAATKPLQLKMPQTKPKLPQQKPSQQQYLPQHHEPLQEPVSESTSLPIPNKVVEPNVPNAIGMQGQLMSQMYVREQIQSRSQTFAQVPIKTSPATPIKSQPEQALPQPQIQQPSAQSNVASNPVAQLQSQPPPESTQPQSPALVAESTPPSQVSQQQQLPQPPFSSQSHPQLQTQSQLPTPSPSSSSQPSPQSQPIQQSTSPPLQSPLQLPPPPQPVAESKTYSVALLEPDANQKPRDIIIVIDPGHGGKDPGASGVAKIKEKDVVLAIAKDLQSFMNQKNGFSVILTRDGDDYIGLRERLRIAHVNKADVFVSLHADIYKNTLAKGSSVYALSQDGATSEAARWLAEKENASELGSVTTQSGNALRSVLLDVAQTSSIKNSLVIADKILEQLSTVNKLHGKKIDQASFVVLKSPDIPSLLVETGFISDPKEEKNLRDPAYQEKFAEALAKGLINYFSENPPPGTYLALEKKRNG